MKKITLGINGFGRIGRTLYRLLEKEPGIRVAMVNDLADAPTLAHLLKYDSIHGPFSGSVQTEGGYLYTPSQKTRVTRFQNPGDIPWKEAGVDLVVGNARKLEIPALLKPMMQRSDRPRSSGPSVPAERRPYIQQCFLHHSQCGAYAADPG